MNCVAAVVEIYKVNVRVFLYNESQKKLVDMVISDKYEEEISIAWIQATSGQEFSKKIPKKS